MNTPKLPETATFSVEFYKVGCTDPVDSLSLTCSSNQESLIWDRVKEQSNQLHEGVGNSVEFALLKIKGVVCGSIIEHKTLQSLNEIRAARFPKMVLQAARENLINPWLKSYVMRLNSSKQSTW